MTRIVGWDKGAFPVPFNQLPVFLCLQVVVMGTQKVEKVEHREVGLGPVDAVIALKARTGGTSLYRTGRIEPFQSALLMDGRLPSEMGDTDDRLRFGQDGRDEGTTTLEEVLHRRNRDRPVTDKFTGLSLRRRASQEGIEVHAK